MSCSQLVEIDALVLGELAAEQAAALRAHARGCAACRRELDRVTAERVLFTHRAAAHEGPPPELARAVREGIAAEAEREMPRRAGRLVRGAVRLLRRGHVTAACAAALFLVAGISRVGADGAGPSGAGGAAVRITAERVASRPLAAALACGAGKDAREGHEVESPADTLACSGAAAATASSGDELPVAGPAPAPAAAVAVTALGSIASLAPEIACGVNLTASQCEATSCEPSVTCSSLRQ